MTRRLALVGALLFVGCALLPRSPLEGWFVARTLWTQAKGDAVACLGAQPHCRELEHARAILVSIDQGDALVTRTEAWLHTAEADGISDLEGTSLRTAAAELALYEGQLRKAVIP